jgi:hypothetical protein
VRAIQTTGTVTPTRQLVVDVPDDVPSGPHAVVVVLDAEPQRADAPGDWGDLTIQEATWPAMDIGLRREDLYESSGR